ncbi:hypothetical protein HanIR_Chr03g0137591 [Helianthus annuus]|nr:hypothetical protein HanIR_Chr03g0137591 [Helianthus annuus]
MPGGCFPNCFPPHFDICFLEDAISIPIFAKFDLVMICNKKKPIHILKCVFIFVLIIYITKLLPLSEQPAYGK